MLRANVLHNQACAGCTDFLCVSKWSTETAIPSDPLAWMVDHGLVQRGHCPDHFNTDGTPRSLTMTSSFSARCRVQEDGKRCGKYFDAYPPLFSSQTQKDPREKLVFWRGFALKQTMENLGTSMNHKTVSAWMKETLRICRVYHMRGVLKNLEVRYVVVDESHYGTCKLVRGHGSRPTRPVSGDLWICNLTVIDRNRKVIGVYQRPVPDRKRPTLANFIGEIIRGHPRVTLVTDGWSGYEGIQQLLPNVINHIVVNHSEGWKNEAGLTSNQVEGTNGVTKNFIRRVFCTFGQTHQIVAERVAVASYFIGAAGWEEKLRRILRAYAWWCSSELWKYDQEEEVDWLEVVMTDNEEAMTVVIGPDTKVSNYNSWCEEAFEQRLKRAREEDFSVVKTGDSAESENSGCYRVNNIHAQSTYETTIGKKMLCTCEDFAANRRNCKHIIAVLLSLGVRQDSEILKRAWLPERLLEFL